MSVLVKGMEMPKKAYKDIYGTLWSNGRFTFTYLNNTISDYEVVEVPTPHGRLIDADALLERFEKEEKAADEHGRDFSFSFKSGGENCTEWWPVQQMLMDAPTVIEAEEANND